MWILLDRKQSPFGVSDRLVISRRKASGYLVFTTFPVRKRRIFRFHTARPSVSVLNRIQVTNNTTQLRQQKLSTARISTARSYPLYQNPPEYERPSCSCGFRLRSGVPAGGRASRRIEEFPLVVWILRRGKIRRSGHGPARKDRCAEKALCVLHTSGFIRIPFRYPDPASKSPLTSTPPPPAPWARIFVSPPENGRAFFPIYIMFCKRAAPASLLRESDRDKPPMREKIPSRGIGRAAGQGNVQALARCPGTSRLATRT